MKTIHKHLLAIAGVDGTHYAGGKSGESPLASRLRQLLEQALSEELTGEQRDYLERILAGALSFLGERAIAEAFKLRTWTDKQAPGSEYHASYRSWMPGSLSAGWRDHLSRLVSKETGQVYFRSELYEVNNEGLRSLTLLAEQGWKILFRPNLSDHFPGRTLAVLLSKPLQKREEAS
jgi:hypothetical protein